MANAVTPLKKDVPVATRVPDYPILEPRQDNQHWWERNGLFNAGVTEFKEQIFLIYRAYDDFHISRLGLAHSRDGVAFKLYDSPLIDTDPTDPYERMGIEDPRVTKIDDTYYILHTSASYHRIGQSPDVSGTMNYIPWRVRVGMHTTRDFRHFKHWGVLLTDIPAKNACLLPEKIDGQFGMYYREHSATGESIKLSMTADFKHWSTPVDIAWPQTETWFSKKVGLGSQPMVVNDGFLVVYHGVDQHDVYRLGLALFDRHDPSRLLWYSNPILEPEMPYEKTGFVAHVVYCCGAILRGTELWIYYGAADRVIGRAVVSLQNVVEI